jgi:hypothetical protein
LRESMGGLQQRCRQEDCQAEVFHRLILQSRRDAGNRRAKKNGGPKPAVFPVQDRKGRIRTSR